MRVVVKIGSNVLTRSDGGLDITSMSSIVDQIAELRSKGVEVVLVTSGAVASGKGELHLKKKEIESLDDVSARQLFSSVGQTKLMDKYFELFREYHIIVGQVLTMKENFESGEQYSNQRNCMEVMLANGVIPIINENDAVSITELMFTDNDELSSLVALMLKAEALVILSSVDGVFRDSARTDLIREINPEDDFTSSIGNDVSGAGRGGMQSKYSVACKVAAAGTDVYVANGRREGILSGIILGKEDMVCTHFRKK